MKSGSPARRKRRSYWRAGLASASHGWISQLRGGRRGATVSPSQNARRIALLANPDSGSGDAPRRRGRAARRSGPRSSAFALDEHEAVSGTGAERLVVAGGDGSIGRAAAAAAGEAMPLAVVPSEPPTTSPARSACPTTSRRPAGSRSRATRRAASTSADGGGPFVNVASLGLAPGRRARGRGARSARSGRCLRGRGAARRRHGVAARAARSAVTATRSSAGARLAGDRRLHRRLRRRLLG